MHAYGQSVRLDAVAREGRECVSKGMTIKGGSEGAMDERGGREGEWGSRNGGNKGKKWL